ncbi:MAG: hypothetical protein FJW14_13505 [Acidimicrobiia bacterium]|nr:hypothetical protein [Acidimicrobiia bacterium]
MKGLGRRSLGVGGWQATAAYLVITIAATWPLTAGLGRDVAWDLGDPVLNIWILAWDAEQLRAILTGDLSRIRSFFDANIFHPAPLTLAYSEHLIVQAVQVFPIYVISENPVLCYNLLFLSTFVLSGLGMFLLVRELTGNWLAAFVAGLVFAFAPYRVPQSSHLQVLSSQWMPFVFYGLRRYFDSGRLAPLGGAAAALIAQGLSSGYYLLYFPPFAAAYALWEIGRRRLWRSRAVWLHLAAAAALAAIVTAPFVLPYVSLRNGLDMARSRPEVARFSADVYSYATAFSEQRLWGDVLQTMPKPEGELFPGIVPVLLALMGSGLWTVAAAPIVAALVLRRVTLDLWLFTVSIANMNRPLVAVAAIYALLLWRLPRLRAGAAAFMKDRGFFAVALVAAVWLSLGVTPRSLGRPLEIFAPYALLFDYVPGFDGLRVPARLAMIATCMLAVLAGFGVARLAAPGQGRPARAVVAILCVAFLMESTQTPFTVNGTAPLRDLNTPDARLYRPARAPGVYREVARLPEGVVIAELPLGNPDYDLRAMYYSIAHWRPLLNGYSGFFPPHYGQLRAALTEVPRHPDVSLEVLRAGGATHVIVHEAAFLGDEGPATSAAFRTLGASEVFRDAGDVLFALPAPR